jgi:cysteine sulfinate desulfinase/cysteine desulfurase-like protein
MGVDAARSLRVSVGWSTTEQDVAAFARALPAVVGRLRSLGRAGAEGRPRA